MLDREQQVFFTLVQAGLWEKDVRLACFGDIDFSSVLKLAEEHFLVGLVAAGMEHITDLKVPTVDSIEFVGQTLLLEQQNVDLNSFIGKLVLRLNRENVTTLLVKGQGVSQSYSRPLWRFTGDVDFIVDKDNYQRGKVALSGMTSAEHEENPFDKHFSVEIKGVSVELHGSMRSMLTKRADDYLDALQVDLFANDRHSVWDNNGVSVLIPVADDHIIFVFTHILKHFFNYGIGLRQFCDWCRLIYSSRGELDMNLLETRLNAMGLITEWKVFGSLAVNWLGMPQEYVPLYSPAKVWKRKAARVVSFVLKMGDLGCNRDMEYIQKSNAILRGIRSFWRHTCDSVNHFFIFPLDAVRIWLRVLVIGVRDAVRGK